MGKIVRLKGVLTGEATLAPDGSWIEKDVRMVYEGTFESMDGEVEVTGEQLERLVTNHNEAHTQLSAAGEVAMADCPPIQLDHSTSARDTVGRLVGRIRLGDFEAKKATFGRMRVLGKENVEKVVDGRWTNVSIGADLEAGKLNELSITPFPAAPKAAMLSKGNKSEGEGMEKEQHEKLRKHLMETHKCTEKEADDKLSKMTDDEKTEMSSKLATPPNDKNETPKDDKGEGKHLSAEQKASVVKLARGIRKASKTVSGEVRMSKIKARFSNLRASAKVTPAEVKAQDFTKLAAMSDEALDAVFDSYEKRQPVILVGQHGSAKSEGIALAAKSAADNKMLAEMAQTMHFSKGVVKKLSEGQMPTSMDVHEQMAGGEGMPTSMDVHEQMKAHLGHLKHLMQTQQHEAAMKHLEVCAKHLEHMRPAGGTKPEGVEGEPSHLSALAENVQTLQNQFEDVIRLVGPVLGIDEAELSKEE